MSQEFEIDPTAKPHRFPMMDVTVGEEPGTLEVNYRKWDALVQSYAWTRETIRMSALPELLREIEDRDRKAPSGHLLYRYPQPLFDTLLVPEVVQEGQASLFSNSQFFPDGRVKVYGRDTNMSQSGQLGTPLGYRLNRLEVVIEKFAHPDDVLLFLKNLGGRIVLSMDSSLSVFAGGTLRPFLDGMPEAQIQKLGDFAKRGVWLHYWHPLPSYDLDSTEAFTVRLDLAPMELRGPMRVKFLLQDTLIAPAMGKNRR